MRGEPLLLALCIFTMPQYYSGKNFPYEKFQKHKKNRTRSGGYRWEETKPGGGFEVKFDKSGPKKTKPSLPKRLRDKGVRYDNVVLSDGYLFLREQ